MKIEKKLIAYSVIALLIGVASIAPLLFLMSGTAKAETTVDKPWFNVDVPYAYWVTSNGTLNSMPLANYDGNVTTGTTPTNITTHYPNGTTGTMPINVTTYYGNGTIGTMPTNNSTRPIENFDDTQIVSEQQAIVLNFTLNPAAENDIADARVEYYELQIYSDKGPISNMSYFVGTNRTNSFDWRNESFHFMRGWFDTNTTCGGMFTYQWNASGTAEISTIAGSGSGTIGSSGTSKLVDALRQAKTIYIDVRRIGWVTFDGNSTVVNSANSAVLQHIQLNRFGDEGFLYNALFPEDKLSEINLTSPLWSQPKP